MPDPEPTAPTLYDDEDEYRPEPEPIPHPPTWMDGSLRIGIHTSIARDLVDSLEIAHKLGCNALQIFSASPRMWGRPGASRISEADAKRYRTRREELGLGPLAVHGNYLINLAAAQPVLRVRSIQTFHDELVRGVTLGADFLVMHPGSRGEETVERAIATIAQGIRQACRGVKFGGLRILLENTAGMGTAVGWRLEELAAILAALPGLPLGVCIDTAHLFAAGYDIATEKGLESTLEQIEQTVGLGRVFVVHMNDSKVPLGSRVDRHEHIGKGKIGLEAFGRILNHPRLAADGPYGVPGRAFILETPIDAPGDDRRNVRTLWGLAGIRVDQAPDAEDGFSMLRSARARKAEEQATRPKKRAAGATGRTRRTRRKAKGKRTKARAKPKRRS
jgi:deoxyribonuclease-4